MNKLLDVAHGKKINIILVGMAFWINIYGWQSCPRMTICVVNQLKNDSYKHFHSLHEKYQQ